MTEYVGFRVGKELKEEAERLAKEESRSLSNMLVLLLKEALEARRRAKAKIESR